MRLRIVTLLVLALAASAALTQPSASATQRWSELGLSRDGRHWSSELTRPLFQKGVVLVPGVTRRRTFYVKNRSNDTAHLRVSVRVRDPHGFLDQRRFRMRVVTGRAVRRVWHGGDRRAGRLVLAPGEVVRLRIRLRMLPGARNRAMGQRLRFQFRLRLTEHPLDRGARP
jgi:hypothetical protein